MWSIAEWTNIYLQIYSASFNLFIIKIILDIVCIYVWLMQQTFWGTFSIVRLWGYWKLLNIVYYKENKPLKYWEPYAEYTHSHPHNLSLSFSLTHTRARARAPARPSARPRACPRPCVLSLSLWYTLRTEVTFYHQNRELGMQLLSFCYIICHSYDHIGPQCQGGRGEGVEG